MKTQVGRKVSIVAALIAAAAIGCSKDKGSSSEGAAAAKGSLGMLPKDADIVMGINFGALRSSDLYKQYAPMLMKAMGDKLDKFKAECGFDPVESIGSMTMGIKGAKGDQDVTVVITGFKKDQLIDCVKKVGDKDGKKVTVDGDYIQVDSPKGPMGMLFVGDSILAHKTPTGTSTKDELIAMSKQAADASPAGSKAFMDVFGKVDSGAGIWFVANGSAAAMKDSPFQFKVAYGSIKVTDGLAADITATMNSEADAKQVVDMAKAQLDQVKGAGMLQDASAEAKGADAHITASVSKEQLEMMASMAKGMLGGLRGGGGDDMGSP